MEHKAISPVPLHRSSSNPTHDHDDEGWPEIGRKWGQAIHVRCGAPTTLARLAGKLT
jgi:hypothetical protein